MTRTSFPRHRRLWPRRGTVPKGTVRSADQGEATVRKSRAGSVGAEPTAATPDSLSQSSHAHTEVLTGAWTGALVTARGPVGLSLKSTIITNGLRRSVPAYQSPSVELAVCQYETGSYAYVPAFMRPSITAGRRINPQTTSDSCVHSVPKFTPGDLG